MVVSILKGGKRPGTYLCSGVYVQALGLRPRTGKIKKQKGGDLGRYKKANGKNPVQKQVRLLRGSCISPRRLIDTMEAEFTVER